jgi:hypothetical protein
MGFPSSRSSEPASRPTARRSPHKSPSPKDGGAVGGSAVGRPAHELPHPSERRSDSEDASRFTSSGGPATDVPGKRSDWRGGRAAASTSVALAARHRAWRVTGVAICAARAATERSAVRARRSVRQAGLYVQACFILGGSELVARVEAGGQRRALSTGIHGALQAHEQAAPLSGRRRCARVAWPSLHHLPGKELGWRDELRVFGARANVDKTASATAITSYSSSLL